jgi:hydrogenase maturation factor
MGKSRTTMRRLRDIRDCPQCMAHGTRSGVVEAVVEAARACGLTTQAMLTRYLRDYHRDGHRQ